MCRFKNPHTLHVREHVFTDRAVNYDLVGNGWYAHRSHAHLHVITYATADGAVRTEYNDIGEVRHPRDTHNGSNAYVQLANSFVVFDGTAPVRSMRLLSLVPPQGCRNLLRVIPNIVESRCPADTPPPIDPVVDGLYDLRVENAHIVPVPCYTATPSTNVARHLAILEHVPLSVNPSRDGRLTDVADRYTIYLGRSRSHAAGRAQLYALDLSSLSAPDAADNDHRYAAVWSKVRVAQPADIFRAHHDYRIVPIDDDDLAAITDDVTFHLVELYDDNILDVKKLRLTIVHATSPQNRYPGCTALYIAQVKSLALEANEGSDGKAWRRETVEQRKH